MSNTIIPRSRRFRLAGAASVLAILSAGCASYAGDSRYGNNDQYGPPVYYDSRANDSAVYSSSNVGVRGIDAAREAHRRYSSDRAEQLDGNCESRVTIRYGETLSDLAEFCDVSVESIIQANPRIRDVRKIAVGEEFYIPGEYATVYSDYGNSHGRNNTAHRSDDRRNVRNDDFQDRDYHIVRRGDTLGDIAARYNVSLSDVMELNRKTRPSNIEIGERIYLPGYARGDQARLRPNREVSIDGRRPAVSFSPVRGPRNGEIRLFGSNFGRGQQVVVLYGDRPDRLQQIRMIEADQSGRINEVVRLPDAYQGNEVYFAMQSGADTFVSDNAYRVDYEAGDRRGLPSDDNYGHASGGGQRSLERSSTAVLRATDREVYRDDTVSLSAVGFPPNTPISIYGGPSRDALTKISEIRSGPTGLFQTEVRVPENVDGETVLFVAAVEDGARTYFTERVRVRSNDYKAYDRRESASGVSVVFPSDENAGLGHSASGPTTLDRGIDRQAISGPGILSSFQKRSSIEVTDINSGGRGAISGVLTKEGKRCPTLRDDAGNIYSLLGDLGRFSYGDRVLIRGSAAADRRICNQSETIQVFAIESAPW